MRRTSPRSGNKETRPKRSLEALQTNQLQSGTETLTNIKIFKSQLQELEKTMEREEALEDYGEQNG